MKHLQEAQSQTWISFFKDPKFSEDLMLNRQWVPNFWCKVSISNLDCFVCKEIHLIILYDGEHACFLLFLESYSKNYSKTQITILWLLQIEFACLKANTRPSFPLIWSYLKKSLMGNLFFCALYKASIIRNVTSNRQVPNSFWKSFHGF